MSNMSDQNEQKFNVCFGTSFNSPVLSIGKVDPISVNYWVWFPNANTDKIPAAVYKFLNSRHYNDENWIGWTNIWKLLSSPRVKTFIWLLCHNRIKTNAFLHAINLGPIKNCVFCGLQEETAKSRSLGKKLLIFLAPLCSVLILLFLALGWIFLLIILPNLKPLLLLLFVGIFGKAGVTRFLRTKILILLGLLKLLWLM